MGEIIDTVKNYEKLLDVIYNFSLGRKGTITNISLAFRKSDCYHLMGLQYLKDISEIRSDREKIFDRIISGDLPEETIINSVFYRNIYDRVSQLGKLELLLDNPYLTFRYSQKNNSFSLIKADYLLQTYNQSKEYYVFLDKEKTEDTYFCRSFFQKQDRDYTLRQTKYTLLYKEKVNTVIGEKIIQLNRLAPTLKSPDKKLSLDERISQAKRIQEARNLETSIIEKVNKERELEPKR